MSNDIYSTNSQRTFAHIALRHAVEYDFTVLFTDARGQTFRDRNNTLFLQSILFFIVPVFITRVAKIAETFTEIFVAFRQFYSEIIFTHPVICKVPQRYHEFDVALGLRGRANILGLRVYFSSYDDKMGNTQHTRWKMISCRKLDSHKSRINQVIKDL